MLIINSYLFKLLRLVWWCWF